MNAPRSKVTQQLWFTQVIEAIFLKGLGARVTPELKAQLVGVGINLDRLEPGYPVETVHKALELVQKQLFPDLTKEQALHELGVLSMRGYTDTFIGKALIKVLQLIGVRRSLLRTHLSMSAGNNYLQTTSTVVHDHCVELHFNDISGMPAFYQGLLEEGARLAHAKNIRTTSVPVPAPAHTFRIEWED
jgi:uncharacterized protein (TIGR02265 family)